MTDRNRERARAWLDAVDEFGLPVACPHPTDGPPGPRWECAECLTALLDEVAGESGLDMEHTTSCGHKWTLRHTACPTCFLALRRERDEARAELRRLTDMAGDWIETDPSLRSSACIEVALDHAKELEADVERLRDQVENLLHRMTSEEAAAEIERLRVERQEDIFRLERLRADAFARAEKAEAEVDRLREELRRNRSGLGAGLQGDGLTAKEASLLREAIKALVEAGDRLDDTITLRTIHKAILDGWAEAKRKAGL